MCMYKCCYLHLAHLLPVCDDCTGHSPEARTATSSWGGARRLEAPAGGSGWETYPSKLERWCRRAEPQLSLCSNHQLCRWADMQWASLTPKRKTSRFNSAHQNVDLFCVTTFSQTHSRTFFLLNIWGKKIQLLDEFYRRDPGWSVLKQFGQTMQQDGGRPLSFCQFCFHKASLQREIMLKRLYTAVCSQLSWAVMRKSKHTAKNCRAPRSSL